MPEWLGRLGRAVASFVAWVGTLTLSKERIEEGKAYGNIWERMTLVEQSERDCREEQAEAAKRHARLRADHEYTRRTLAHVQRRLAKLEGDSSAGKDKPGPEGK